MLRSTENQIKNSELWTNIIEARHNIISHADAVLSPIRSYLDSKETIVKTADSLVTNNSFPVSIETARQIIDDINKAQNNDITT